MRNAGGGPKTHDPKGYSKCTRHGGDTLMPAGEPSCDAFSFSPGASILVLCRLGSGAALFIRLDARQQRCLDSGEYDANPRSNQKLQPASEICFQGSCGISDSAPQVRSTLCRLLPQPGEWRQSRYGQIDLGKKNSSNHLSGVEARRCLRVEQGLLIPNRPRHVARSPLANSTRHAWIRFSKRHFGEGEHQRKSWPHFVQAQRIVYAPSENQTMHWRNNALIEVSFQESYRLCIRIARKTHKSNVPRERWSGTCKHLPRKATHFQVEAVHESVLSPRGGRPISRILAERGEVCLDIGFNRRDLFFY